MPSESYFGKFVNSYFQLLLSDNVIFPNGSSVSLSIVNNIVTSAFSGTVILPSELIHVFVTVIFIASVFVMLNENLSYVISSPSRLYV